MKYLKKFENMSDELYKEIPNFYPQFSDGYPDVNHYDIVPANADGDIHRSEHDRFEVDYDRWYKRFYGEIDDKEYSLLFGVLKDKFTDNYEFSLVKEPSKRNYLSHLSARLKSKNSMKVRCRIYKLYDDWWILSIIQSDLNRGDGIIYKCDQLDGLIQCIDDKM